jgi:hypothetical protein
MERERKKKKRKKKERDLLLCLGMLMFLYARESSGTLINNLGKVQTRKKWL